MEFVLAVESGMTPHQALVAGTVMGAEVLATTAATGSLEAGKHADIVALHANPLENISAVRQCLFVVKRGNAVHMGRGS